ncbi:hypothetical protein [Streptosporangium sp. 'caverna']|uniref:aggregation-promoting factor C-terminal-like domain-containing protein n=1 Tax=Streptosporangium sp. 'caverna' TaxID=2202249 RepID=UPI0019550E99|nr:hypothetical protein [Streptosporangium sp. 'caverna']
MNSYRLVRNTVVTMIAASTMVGSAAVGRAEETVEPSGKGTEETVREDSWSTQAEPGVTIRENIRTAQAEPGVTVHEGIWSTKAAPRAVVRESTSTTRAKPGVAIRRSTWPTRANPGVTALGGTSSIRARPSVAIHQSTWSTKVAPRIRLATRTAKGRNKAIAYRLVSRRAWSHSQFRCLDSLWTRESNWNHRAYNQSSGAYGIPQALPGSKMGGSGGDWRYNPFTQIHWGLNYIKSRYGSPCGAWGHFQSSNWY